MRPDQSTPSPIAIIGIGCRFPGAANTPQQLWHMLRDGHDAIGPIPPDRWLKRAFYDPDPAKPGKTYARWGGFIDGIDQFDAQFFGMSPREATRADPQQRVLMEVAYEALEDAGLPPERIAGTNTGVFVGIATLDYGGIQSSSTERAEINAYTNLGLAMCIAANRISYFFDLHGPSFAVDTACSSSLVDALLAIDASECHGFLATQIRDQLARVLGRSPSKLDVEQSLLNLGIDSLMAVEIGNQIQAMVGVDVPAMKFMEGISIAGLSAYVIDQLAPADADAAAAADVAVAGSEADQVAEQIEQLSDAEVDALLLELAGANGHNAPGANGSGNGVHAAEEVRQ